MSLSGNRNWGGNAEYPDPVAAHGPSEVVTQGVIGPGLLQNWLAALDIVHPEAPLVFDSEGIHASVVNEAKTQQLETTLFAEAFEEFQHFGDEPTERIVALRPFHETARLAEPDAEEAVSITVDQPGQPLHLRAGPVDRTVAAYDDLGTLRASELERDYDYRAAIDRRQLVAAARHARVPFRAMDGFGSTSDQYHIRGEPDGTLHVIGDSDIDNVDAPVATEDAIRTPETAVEAVYSGELVRDVVGSIPDGAVVSFQFASDTDFRLRWTLKQERHGEQRPVAEAEYHVAPILQSGGGA